MIGGKPGNLDRKQALTWKGSLEISSVEGFTSHTEETKSQS